MVASRADRAPSLPRLKGPAKSPATASPLVRIVRGLSALAIGALVIFHAVLFAGRIADASLAHPEVLARWLGTLLLGAGALALRRQRKSLLSGREALAFWLLVLLLHVGFGSGLGISGVAGTENLGARELLLLLPFAGFAAACSGSARSDRPIRHLSTPISAPGSRLRYPVFEPSPAVSSAGAGPQRFSPRPPPHS